MNVLDFVFRLGVLFAIYGFIWGIIDITIRLLSSGRNRTLSEIYFFKAIKYILLVDVTFLFCWKEADTNGLLNHVIFAGIILLTYFVGKLQKSQNRSLLFRFAGPGFPKQQKTFNMQAEIVVIALALVIFSLFWFFPHYAENPISLWFRDSIKNIETTPIFGFIFKVIGFFFLLNLIFKMMNTLTFLLNGGSLYPKGMRNNEPPKDDNHFDDYEEVE